MITMEVIVDAAPLGYERYQGEKGSLGASNLGYVFWPQGESAAISIKQLDGWVFRVPSAFVGTTPPVYPSFLPEEPTQASVSDPAPERRAREVYDQTSFTADLDLAINYIRSTVLGGRRSTPADPHIPPGTPMRESIARVCDALVLRASGMAYGEFLDVVLENARELLITKNKQYGDSALNPLRVYSTASLKEQLLVRLDDKISRLARGSAAGEDVAADMLGYLLLVAIAEKRERDPGLGAGEGQ